MRVAAVAAVRVEGPSWVETDDQVDAPPQHGALSMVKEPTTLEGSTDAWP
jgi:hypothetical protein